MDQPFFRRCSTCKSPIAFEADYYKCSVSTCNRRATALFFCSVPCWDAHVPDARHRDAWAEKEKAPSRAEAERAEQSTEAPVRRVVSQRTQSDSESIGAGAKEAENVPIDVLIVMSKLKAYIKAKSGLRTSDGVSDPLSDAVRALCTRAIESARNNERGTILARDVEAAMRGEDAAD